MALTTLAQVQNGLVPPIFINKGTVSASSGRWTSHWYASGFPAAGVADTSTAGGVALTGAVTGNIPRTNALSGNQYLARFGLNNLGTTQVNFILIDRLWNCGANSAGGALDPTSTTAQTINSVTWPARDADGATAGKDVIIGIEVSSGTGSATPVFTLTYTNSAGTGSRTANTVLVTGATVGIGSFFPIGLQAGDVGVQSVQSIQSNASWISGQYNLVAYRILAMGSCNYITNDLTPLTMGFPLLSANAVIQCLVMPPQTISPPMVAQYVEAQG